MNIQLPPNQFGALAALTAITKHLDKQIEKATLTNVQHQEVVIEVHRFGEGGEPLTLRVLCCAKYSNERDWEAFPDGEVVETKGDYKAGEVIHLTLEELDEVKREGEREYSR